MQKLLFVNDVAERYGVSKQTARKIMRSMIHSEWPKLNVTETALMKHEMERTSVPNTMKRVRRV